jgi:1,4-dihydroxy-2-naphthoate octaprenyltransferase
MKFHQLLKFWFINSRPHALAQSLLPGLLAVSLAAGQEGFSLVLALLAILGAELAHMGINLFDDYFDYRHQNTVYRDLMAREGMRARIAKCPFLTSGRATINQLLAACIVCCVLAIFCGLPIIMTRGAPVLWLVALTAGLGLAYSGWPLRLSYRGLGEIEIGVIFGPMMMSGVYFAACGKFEPSLLLIFIPVGLLVMNIVYSHAIMDVEPDQRVGKMTLAVLAGSPLGRLLILAFVLTVPYLMVSFGVAFSRLSPTYLLVFLTLPAALALFRLMYQFVKEPGKPIFRKFWMGPMSRWKTVQANGIEWFMIRWYLSRNLLLFFCLTIMAAGFLS